jgi:hypothetical protein
VARAEERARGHCARSRQALDRVDRLEARPLSLRVIRHADGDVNFERLLRASTPVASRQRGPPRRGEWNVVVRKLCSSGSPPIRGPGAAAPVKLSIQEARIARKTSATRAATRHDRLHCARGLAGPRAGGGRMATRPFAIDWKIDVAQIDSLAASPVLRGADERDRHERRTRPRMDGSAMAELAGGTAAAFAGDTAITDFGALDRPTMQELVRWKTLTVSGVDVASAPRKIVLGRHRARRVLRPAHRQSGRVDQPATALRTEYARRRASIRYRRLPQSRERLRLSYRQSLRRRRRGVAREAPGRCRGFRSATSRSAGATSSSRTSTSSRTIRRT